MTKIDRTKTLYAKYSKKEKGIVYYHPNRPDGHFLYNVFSSHHLSDNKDKSILKLLEERGYDIKTLKFSIKKL